MTQTSPDVLCKQCGGLVANGVCVVCGAPTHAGSLASDLKPSDVLILGGLQIQISKVIGQDQDQERVIVFIRHPLGALSFNPTDRVRILRRS